MPMILSNCTEHIVSFSWSFLILSVRKNGSFGPTDKSVTPSDRIMNSCQGHSKETFHQSYPLSPVFPGRFTHSNFVQVITV